jgi:hypothetical protein
MRRSCSQLLIFAAPPFRESVMPDDGWGGVANLPKMRHFGQFGTPVSSRRQEQRSRGQVIGKNRAQRWEFLPYGDEVAFPAWNY